MARKPRITHAAGYKMKGVKVYVALRRDVSPTDGKPRFSACAALKWHKKRHGWMPHVGANFVCRSGRNPRHAVAFALAAFARNIAVRRGAFAGV